MTDEDEDESELDMTMSDGDDDMFPPDFNDDDQQEPHKEATQTTYKIEPVNRTGALIVFLVLLGLFLIYIWWVLSL